MDHDLILTKREGGIGFVVLNRPERRNSLNLQMLQILPGILAGIEKKKAIRVIVFRGGGSQSFCAGGDITEFKEHSRNRQNALRIHEALMAAIESVYRIHVPTIAMIHGAAVGAGFEIAMACDIRMSASDAVYGIPGARFGFPIPFRNAFRLISHVGPARAKEMLFTGELIQADKAFEFGLVNAVFSKAALETQTLNLAKRIADNAPLALKAIKHTINHCLEDPSLSRIHDPSHLFVQGFLSEDFQEGLSSIVGKRAPKFKGR